ncbi:Imm2 family immunity protein [Herbaspirillum huttiense]|uniref:Imm2 family immunity protein n=2 Tax=Herbaspirillum huttiense TaxID=863372 RepID=A0AAJ2LX14_9BURK|nr:Imm2 family immunity protein [Herbaspirillum huttiense]MDR9838666.1 Imm2 family immunity protein [Herbaspirillum huttiense]
MLEVLTLVLDARRSSDAFQREHQENILQILSEKSLSDLLSNLPEEERKSFEFDLKRLKIF